MGLATLLYFVAYGPTFNELAVNGLYAAILYGALILNAAVSLLIMYSFWLFKSWGRHLAIYFNGFYLLTFGAGLISLLINNPTNIASAAGFFSIIACGIPIAIIALCLKRETKELMRDED